MMLKVLTMAEFWFFTILAAIFCCGAGAILICVVMINSFMRIGNDGKEGGEDKNDGQHG